MSEEAAAKSASPQVSDAIARGARLLMGNVRAGALYLPTVADRRRSRGARHAAHEIPDVRAGVAPIMRFRDIDDAIRMSNSADDALSSSICTNRFDGIARFIITELEVGSVNVRTLPSIGSN